MQLKSSVNLCPFEHILVFHLHRFTANQPASLSCGLKSQSFSRSRVLWHLHDNLADSCYAFIHPFVHLTAHEYKCDGLPVISGLSPLWVILPQRLMLYLLMHIHQSNKKIRIMSAAKALKRWLSCPLLEFILQWPVFKWEFRRWADCWDKEDVQWHRLPV